MRLLGGLLAAAALAGCQTVPQVVDASCRLTHAAQEAKLVDLGEEGRIALAMCAALREMLPGLRSEAAR